MTNLNEGGWYTCVVAEVEETQEIVGYSVWEWYEYDEKYKRIDEAYRPTKIQAIWDSMGAEEPTHRPPRSYGPEAYQDPLLQARWHAEGPGSKYDLPHEALLVTSGSTSVSQFWQIDYVAVDPRPEHSDKWASTTTLGSNIGAP
ncbi:hypothetical protein F5144DRAFT_594275 [Chaetomium tenue]|uniref:Uncharacterized protein n=1 Tax=Chaetomium tenue TaxID=1854479 RepID=A0ACB7P2L2_9PEZI|nr:hypothetical protein F5144DRAFT_594275 [Chaetomium globosum]